MPTIYLKVKVKPNSRQSKLEHVAENRWVATLRSPPEDGKANAELIALVAGHLGCGKSSVAIKFGIAARTKLIQVQTE